MTNSIETVAMGATTQLVTQPAILPATQALALSRQCVPAHSPTFAPTHVPTFPPSLTLAPSARPFPVVLNRQIASKPGSHHKGKQDRLPALVHYERELHRDALLRHIPSSGDVKLDSFIATVFAEPTLSAAYWERFISPGHKPGGKPTLAIDLAVLAMERAMNYPPLRREEKAVAGVAAFLFDAGRYLDLYEKNRSQGEHPGRDEVGMFEARNDALYYALRTLRGRQPQVAALLGAVFQVHGSEAEVEAEGLVDEHQLARVRAAVLRAHSSVQAD